MTNRPALTEGTVPVRVLLVTPRFPPFAGGVEHHVHEVARRVAAKGAEVTVLTTDSTGTLPTRESSEGFQVLRVPAWPAKADYYVAPQIYRSITRGAADWDVIHVQSYHTFVAPLAMLAALRTRIPYVVTFHGGGHSSWLRAALRPVQLTALGPLLRRAERLVALARFEIELYGTRLGVPPNRFALVPTGIDLLTALPPTAPSGSLIASVGRLERYKGHHRVIAALPHLLRTRPDARLWIAGSGPYESALRQQARDLGVADHVEIRAVPVIEREMMARELSKAAVIVLMSEFETQPAAVLEGLALGRPALVADTSGLSELSQRGLVRAIPLASSPEQVASALLAQLERPHLPDRHTIPTWDDCTSQLFDLYQSIATARQHKEKPPVKAT